MTSKIREMSIEEFNTLITNSIEKLIKDILNKRIHPLEEKIEYISKKLEDLELLFIQEEELEESELKELKILSSETSKNGIPWKKLKAELNL